MSDQPNKWFDSETLSVQDPQTLPLKAMHKKIAKKHDNISKGLRDYKESLMDNKEKFLGWTKAKKSDQNAKTAKLLASASNFNELKAELTIKKLFKTDQRDAIGSMVQALDYCTENQTYAYAGLDKVLKFAKHSTVTPKGYDIVSSIFFEGLPILGVSYANKDSILLNYHNKNFISLYDLPSQKSTHFYKLFNTESNPHKTIINKNGLAIVSNTKEIAFFDTSKKISTQKVLQPDTIKDLCFVGESDIAVAYKNDYIKIFDIRVSAHRPKHVIKKSVDVIASNGKYLASGNHNGIVQLFDVSSDYNVLKIYDNITTEINSISLNNSFMAFASKWKNNSVRIVDMRNFNVLQSWPNIKTRLDVINRIFMNDSDQLVCGTSKGSLDAYQLKLA